MADNTEIKRVITVDTGNSISSLSEYKNKIDSLESSLSTLDETSEEYSKLSKELADTQEELNDAISDAKTVTDTAAKAYSDLGDKIDTLNGKMDNLDEKSSSIGDSISQYGNAFGSAFDKVLDGVKKVDGPLGEIGGTTKDMIPVIKNINSTAIKGLSGIKKGIASTGIGLLVIAVAELVTHWRDLVKIVGISDEQFAEFKDTAINTFKNIVSGAVGVGDAIGNFLLAPIRATIEAFRGLGNIIRDVFTGNFGKVKDDATAAFEAIKGIGQKAVDFRGNYERGREIADNMIAGIESRMKSGDAEEKLEEVGKSVGKTIGTNIKEGIAEETEEIEKEIDSATQSILDRLHKRNTDEIELLREKYEEEKAMLEQYGLDTTDLQREFEEEAEKIIDKRLEAERKAIEEQEKLQEELTKKEKEESEKQLAIKRAEQMQLLSASINLSGALSDLAEEGSEEAKAFSIMQTILNTLQSIMGIWAGYSEMGPFGVAAAAVQTAAVTAMGAATIAKMKSTNKNSASSISVSAPTIETPSMTTVSPLLDEQADMNRMDMSGMEGLSSQSQQNLRVYVVDQDIRDANRKAEVVEDNATF